MTSFRNLLKTAAGIAIVAAFLGGCAGVPSMTPVDVQQQATTDSEGGGE